MSWTLLREFGVSMRGGASDLGASPPRAWAAEERGGPRFGTGPLEGTRSDDAVDGVVRIGGPRGGGIRLDAGFDVGDAIRPGIGLGGAMRVGDDFGGAIRPGVGFDNGGGIVLVGLFARCAELAAGNIGRGRLSRSSSSSSWS